MDRDQALIEVVAQLGRIAGNLESLLLVLGPAPERDAQAQADLLGRIHRLEARISVLEAQTGPQASPRCLAITHHAGEVLQCSRPAGHWNLERYDPHKAVLSNGHTLLWPG